jgi:integrase
MNSRYHSVLIHSICIGIRAAGACVDVHNSKLRPAHAACQSCAPVDGHLLARHRVDADLAAEEQLILVTERKVEHSCVLQKELPLVGNVDWEWRKVDVFLVHVGGRKSVFQVSPTMPLTHEEMVKLLAACDTLAAKAQPGAAKLNALRLKPLILTMRFSGLRVSDAVLLTTDRLDGKKLFLYTAKTGVPVYTILPDSVVRALAECPRVSDTRFFWSGQGKRTTAVCDWQGRIKDAFDSAGIVKGLSNAVSHRLRDSFACELLRAGATISNVATLLGNSPRIVEKHYSPWVRSPQEQLEADLGRTWKLDPTLAEIGGLQTKVTYGGHGKSARYN